MTHNIKLYPTKKLVINHKQYIIDTQYHNSHYL